MEENNRILDSNLAEEQDLVPVPADKNYIKKAYLWAYLGGIGGIIMGHNIAWGSEFKNGKVQYIYDMESRNVGKRIQHVGLLIWIPIYLVFLGFYIKFLFSFVGGF